MGLRAVVVIAGIIIASVEVEGDKGVSPAGVGVVGLGVPAGSTVGNLTGNGSVLFTFVSKHLKYLEVQNKTYKLANILSANIDLKLSIQRNKIRAKTKLGRYFLVTKAVL